MEELTNVSCVDKNKEALIAKASSFWKFLDDLATNDPAAYQEFMYKNKQSYSKMINPKNINNNNKNNDNKVKNGLFDEFDKNIENAKQTLNGTNNTKNEYYFTPMPFMVIKTKISSTKTMVETLLNVNDYRNAMKKGEKLYINFLESPYCKPLQSKSKPNIKITDNTPICDILVPIQTSKLLNEDKYDQYWRCDVIYHNTIYQRFNNENNDKSQLFKKWIIEYALRRIEAQNSIKLMRDYKILKKKKFYGKTPPNPQFIGNNNQHKMEETKQIEIEQKSVQQIDKKPKIKKMEKIQDNDNLLTSLFSIGSNIRNDIDDEKKKENIMETKSFLIPKYTLNVDTEKKNIIKIVIELEKENNFKDIELEMNESKLLLKSQHYKLQIVFPKKINHNEIKAKFDKNKHCLKLKLPIKQ